MFFIEQVLSDSVPICWCNIPVKIDLIISIKLSYFKHFTLNAILSYHKDFDRVRYISVVMKHWIIVYRRIIACCIMIITEEFNQNFMPFILFSLEKRGKKMYKSADTIFFPIPLMLFKVVNFLMCIIHSKFNTWLRMVLVIICKYNYEMMYSMFSNNFSLIFSATIYWGNVNKIIYKKSTLYIEYNSRQSNRFSYNKLNH
jgi:hypothetical protein